MVWHLQTTTSDEWELQWGDELSKAKIEALPEEYSSLGRLHGQPFHPQLPTIPYGQTSDHSVVPEVCQGRYGFNVFVNRGMRQLIEDMDPETHFYHPIDLHLKSGEVLRDEYHLLRAGALIDGIVVEESQLVPKYYDGVLSHYNHGAVRPRVTWRREAIEGRHFWMDKYFEDKFYCSDAFLEALNEREYGHFRALPAFVK